MYADPGYHGEPRLPLDTDERIIAAWARMGTAQGYDPIQRETIKARIRRQAFARGLELVALNKREARKVATVAEVREAAPHDDLSSAGDVSKPLEAYIAPQSEGESGALEVAEVHAGCMVALYPRASVAGRLAVDGGESESDLHVTLAYLGSAEGIDVERLHSVVAGVAEGTVPLSGEVSGIGVFTADPANTVTYASIDLPGLPTFRQRLFDALVDASFPVATSHGYTPHMTLTYDERRDLVVPNVPLEFDEVWVVAAGVKTAFALRGDETPYEENIGPAEPAGEVTVDLQVKGAEKVIETFARTKDRIAELSEPKVEQTRAFVTELAGKTLLTAPIETLKAENVGANPHFLWLEGAFVGAEEVNRNNAFWSTGDLEFGELTVKNGPLNWLHEAQHIIGSIPDGRLVTPVEGASDGAFAVPHIRATAAVWRWIFPDEAEIIEIAAEVGKLYYSMECISESIMCAGEAGCGQSFDYTKVMRGMGCEHLTQRSSVRHLVNPTFLGGAVIVPPVRPGWAHADVSILRQAAALAEDAYDQAGRPDMEASVWEQLMAEVVTYART